MQDQVNSNKIMSWCTSEDKLTIGIPKLNPVIDDDYREKEIHRDMSPKTNWFLTNQSKATLMRRKVNFSGFIEE